MEKLGQIVIGVFLALFIFLITFSAIEGTLGNYIPWFQNAQTNVLRQTNQYQTSTQSGLLTLDSSYRKLQAEIDGTTNPSLKQDYLSQQRVIQEQMKEQASTLYASQIPPSVLSDINQP